MTENLHFSRDGDGAHIGRRWRLCSRTLLCGLMAALAASASDLQGELIVTVLDAVDHSPIQRVDLYLDDVPRFGDLDVEGGVYIAHQLSVGTYTLRVDPHLEAYLPVKLLVNVEPNPPPTELTVELARFDPTPIVEIHKPDTSTVGNTAPVVVRFHIADEWMMPCYYRVEVIDDDTGLVVFSLVEESYPWSSLWDHVVGSYQDYGGKNVYIAEVTSAWETTGHWNDSYRVNVVANYNDPWNTHGGTITREDSQTYQVENITVH